MNEALEPIIYLVGCTDDAAYRHLCQRDFIVYYARLEDVANDHAFCKVLLRAIGKEMIIFAFMDNLLECRDQHAECKHQCACLALDNYDVCHDFHWEIAHPQWRLALEFAWRNGIKCVSYSKLRDWVLLRRGSVLHADKLKPL